MDPIHIGSADITVDLFAQIVPTPTGLSISVSAQQRTPNVPVTNPPAADAGTSTGTAGTTAGT